MEMATSRMFPEYRKLLKENRELLQINNYLANKLNAVEEKLNIQQTLQLRIMAMEAKLQSEKVYRKILIADSKTIVIATSKMIENLVSETSTSSTTNESVASSTLIQNSHKETMEKYNFRPNNVHVSKNHIFENTNTSNVYLESLINPSCSKDDIPLAGPLETVRSNKRKKQKTNDILCRKSLPKRSSKPTNLKEKSLKIKMRRS